MSDEPRPILLTPGPANTSAAVKRAAAGPDECPRERDFSALIATVRAQLLQVAGADPASHSAVLLSGSGTTAAEAALGSLIPRTGRLLVLDNGAYGARAAQIAERLGLAAEVWRLSWTERPDPARWRSRLAGGRFTHAYWVHHETSTGLLNPLAEFAAACADHGVAALVDAISSFGGIDLPWGRLPVDAVIASANKCLQGLPGLSFVIARRSALAQAAPRSLALDLALHAQVQESDGQFPFTPPTPLLRALACALAETLAETVARRAARYQANYAALTGGMAARGWKPLLPAAWHSQLLTAFEDPTGQFDALHDFLRARGITIYPGKVPGLNSFRLGHLGAITPADQLTVLAAVDAFLAVPAPSR